MKTVTASTHPLRARRSAGPRRSGGANWYAYVNNDPVNFVDPWGLSPSDRRPDPAMGDVAALGLVPAITAENVAHLKEAQDLTRSNPFYQPGAGGPYNEPADWKRWCNQSTFDIAEATGVNVNLLTGGQWRMSTGANSAIPAMDRAVQAGGLSSLPPAQAQTKANEGWTVIAAWPDPAGQSHMATVRPTDRAFDEAKGPLVSNVGETVSLSDAVDAFGRAESLADVKYYYDPQQSFEYRRSAADWWQRN